MPEPGENESEKDFIARCIPIVLEDGTAEDEKQAAAICYSKWREAKGEKTVVPPVLDDALKVGARHSQQDQRALQDIHDAAITLGAECPQPKGEVYEFALMSADKALVSFGTEVKALGNGKVAGYLVRFGDPDNTDLSGEYFTKDTDFGDVTRADVYYQHGADTKIGRRKLGKGDLKEDELGVWIEAQLNLRDEYEKAIYQMSEAGKMGWSSGTAAHLVERAASGKAYFIKSWPLGLDASITPTPAEPRNTVIPLKSYLDDIHAIPTMPGTAGDAVAKDGRAEITNQPSSISEDTMEFNQEQFEKAVGDSIGKMGDTIGKMVEASTAKAVETALKSLPAVNSAGVAVIHDEADTPFAKMGDYLSAVKQATLTQGRELAPRLKALNIKALGANELVGSEGGFLLEPSFAAALLTPLHDAGPFSSRANRLPIGPNANGVIVRAIDETSRATGSRWGGIQGYRLAEAGTKLATNPTFRFVELRLKKYAVLCYATEELLQDTTALAGIIQQGCAEELDFMVNDDILNGTGAGGPLGILNAPCLVSVTKEAGQAAATLVTQNIFKMWARLHPRSKSNAVWFINTDATPQLYQLALSVGTGGMPMYMSPGSLPNAPSGALLGKPVVETEFNATLGTKGDILLADMSQYAIIDRDVQAASSIHVQFLTDQVAYRFVYRVDGQPKWSSPLTPYKGGANTLSPFVTLDARA